MFSGEEQNSFPQKLSKVILFSVSVPVLSEHITDTAPAVSVATIFFMSAFSFACFIILSASDTATIVGSPSGTAATIKITHDTNKLCTPEKLTVPDKIIFTRDIIKTTTAKETPITVIVLPSFESL